MSAIFCLSTQLQAIYKLSDVIHLIKITHTIYIEYMFPLSRQALPFHMEIFFVPNENGWHPKKGNEKEKKEK